MPLLWRRKWLVVVDCKVIVGYSEGLCGFSRNDQAGNQDFGSRGSGAPASMVSLTLAVNMQWPQHVDSFDKLKPYGIAINGCTDGFSRHIMWMEA